jgi:16S rRNA (cytosine1402-N4)-methyltransferase
MNYHDPVLYSECLQGLVIEPDGVYVDVTFGGGGHSRGILKELSENGKLFAFDQDPDALANVPEDSRFTLIAQNFRHLKKFLRLYGIKQINGLLADLGVSSHQFDEGSRGFSTRFDGPMDMRMNPSQELNAHRVLNEYTTQDLARIFRKYGEVKNPMSLAHKIDAARAEGNMETTQQLVELVSDMAPHGKRNKWLAQVFQALRIEVNQELQALEEMLEQASEVLAQGGRLVVISYHSLEDRLVKNFIREGRFDGQAEKDFFGNTLTPLKIITRKPIVPTEEELQRNTRSRSAKLRIGEKKESTPKS